MGKGGYVRIGEEDDSTTVIFCLPEKVGVLADALKIFQVSSHLRHNNTNENIYKINTVYFIFRNITSDLNYEIS